MDGHRKGIVYSSVIDAALTKRADHPNRNKAQKFVLLHCVHKVKHYKFSHLFNVVALKERWPPNSGRESVSLSTYIDHGLDVSARESRSVRADDAKIIDHYEAVILRVVQRHQRLKHA